MKNIIYDSFAKLAGRFGLTVVPTWRAATYNMARHLSNLFDMYNIDCVFDVGANTGGFGDFLRREVGYRGFIVSMEPTQRAFLALQRRAASDEKWITRNVALGAKAGSMSINVMRYGVFSSFLSPNNKNVPQFQNINSTEYKETVDMIRFDDIFDEIKKSVKFQNAYLKTDTQGYDLEVISGAECRLGEVRAMQMEMSLIPIYEGMPDFQDALRYVSERGFKVSSLFPVSNDDLLRLVEFDCVLVRSSAASNDPVG